MTDDVRIRARTFLEGITPGKWRKVRAGDREKVISIISDAGSVFQEKVIAGMAGRSRAANNASFIASAPSLVRELVAELERLQSYFTCRCQRCGTTIPYQGLCLPCDRELEQECMKNKKAEEQAKIAEIRLPLELDLNAAHDQIKKLELEISSLKKQDAQAKINVTQGDRESIRKLDTSPRKERRSAAEHFYEVRLPNKVLDALEAAESERDAALREIIHLKYELGHAQGRADGMEIRAKAAEEAIKDNIS